MPITKDNIKSNISLSKVEVDIDLSKELKGLDSSLKKEISAEVSDMLRREIGGDAVNKQLSSVTGKKFKGLTKKYKELKKKAGKGTKANLVLDGDMLGNFKSTNSVQKVKLKVTKSKEIKKFYNHNTPQSADAPLPQRQVLPNEGEQFRSGLMKKINRIIREKKKES